MKILIADDRQENRNAARSAFPHATVVASARGAIAALSKLEFDLVITDLQMEKPFAGHDVVRAAYEKSIPSYVLTSVAPSHGQKIIELVPYGKRFATAKGKADAQLWIDAISLINDPANDASRSYIHILNFIRQSGSKPKVIDCSIPLIYTPYELLDSYFNPKT